MTSANSLRAFSLLCLLLALSLCACGTRVCTTTPYWIADPVVDGDPEAPLDGDRDVRDNETAEDETDLDSEAEAEAEPETEPEAEVPEENEAEIESEEALAPAALALNDFDLLEPVSGGFLAYDWTTEVPPEARVQYYPYAAPSSPTFTQSGSEALLAAPREASHLALSTTEDWAIFLPFRFNELPDAPQLVLRHQTKQTFTYYGLTLPATIVGTPYRAVFLPQNPKAAAGTFLFAVIALWHNESTSDYMTARVFKAVLGDTTFTVSVNGETQLIGLGRRVDAAPRLRLLTLSDHFFVGLHDQLYRFNGQGLYAPEQGNFKPSFAGVSEGATRTLIDAAYSADGDFLSVLMRIETDIYWGIWRTNNMDKTWSERVLTNGSDTLRTNFAPQSVYAVASEADPGATPRFFVLDLSGLTPKPWENALYTYGRPTFLDKPERLLRIAPLSTDGGKSFSYPIDTVDFTTLRTTPAAAK